MWGRQLYMNVQKFLIFQLTVNMVFVLSSLAGCVIGHLPFNVLQMLWLNLVMDILGAMALCTEPWMPGTLVPRVSRGSNLLTPAMTKIVIVQSIYQVLVILVL